VSLIVPSFCAADGGNSENLGDVTISCGAESTVDSSGYFEFYYSTVTYSGYVGTKYSGQTLHLGVIGNTGSISGVYKSDGTIIAGTFASGSVPFTQIFTAEETTETSNTQSAEIQATVKATTFSVDVPTVLPTTTTSDGNTVEANSGKIKITNNSAGAVTVTSVKVTAKSDWTLKKKADLDSAKINSKWFSLYINNLDTYSATTSQLASSFSQDYIEASGTGEFTYDVSVSAQTTALTDAEVASVVFTLAWYQG
jgi:hypothetical protein